MSKVIAFFRDNHFPTSGLITSQTDAICMSVQKRKRNKLLRLIAGPSGFMSKSSPHRLLQLYSKIDSNVLGKLQLTFYSLHYLFLLLFTKKIFPGNNVQGL